MSESICFKCKWHEWHIGDDEEPKLSLALFGFCSWAEGNKAPLPVSQKMFPLNCEISSCPTFEPREEESCLNCKHANWGHDCTTGECEWKRLVDLPHAYAYRLVSTSISKEKPYTNCPTWEAK